MDLNIKTIVVGALKTNCYVVSCDNLCFIVDPGDESNKIIEHIENNKLELKFILLTHGHFDHLLALDKITARYPKVKVYVGEKDQSLIESINEQKIFVWFEQDEIKTVINSITEGEIIEFCDRKIEVLETPGHTIGSVAYLIDNNLFSGDTLFYHTIGRTDLPHSNPVLMQTSLNKILKQDEGIYVYPGHEQKTTIGEERKFN